MVRVRDTWEDEWAGEMIKNILLVLAGMLTMSGVNVMCNHALRIVLWYTIHDLTGVWVV